MTQTQIFMSKFWLWSEKGVYKFAKFFIFQHRENVSDKILLLSLIPEKQPMS